MNVEFFPINDISKFESTIDNMIKENHLTPFQNYQWLSILVQQHSTNLLMRITTKATIAVLYDSVGKIKIIAPLYFKKTKKNYFCFILGSGTESDYLDFVYYKDIEQIDFDTLFDLIHKKYGDFSFVFERLKEDSKLFNYLKLKNDTKILSKKSCVELQINCSFESYMNSLAKKTRQNIRTAYNRLNKDELMFSFEFKKLIDIDDNTINSILKIYSERYKVKNRNISYRNKIKSFLTKKLSFDALNKALKMRLNMSVAIFYINYDVAAFGLIMQSSNNIHLVPRVSINNDYSWYSPGVLMFVEWIKFLKITNQNFMKNLVIDLTNGDEQYKYNLGGINTYNYSGILG